MIALRVGQHEPVASGDMSTHARPNTRDVEIEASTLEASRPKGESRQVHAAGVSRESGGTQEREKGRPALPQPRRQYARCLEKKKKQAMKRNASTRDPRGGLTAAGRAEFARKDGTRLKPGVKKAKGDMTADDKKRKGSWAVRFYGRAGKLPPLIKGGKPTRFALTAAAWGEPVPKTAAAARRIAAKGRRLLAQYKREKNA